MLINVLRAITKVDGTPYQRPADADNPRPENMVNITLGWVIVEAILMSADGKILPPSEHLDRYLLAQKFYHASLPVEITNAEADLIKKQIAARWGQAIQIAGQAIYMISHSLKVPATPPKDDMPSAEQQAA